MEIRIFGIAENGVPVCLGWKGFNVSTYVGRTKLKMELGLDDSLFHRNKLYLQMTIVPLAESKKITEAFLRSEPDLGTRLEQPVLQELQVSQASFSIGVPAEEEQKHSANTPIVHNPVSQPNAHDK